MTHLGLYVPLPHLHSRFLLAARRHLAQFIAGLTIAAAPSDRPLAAAMPIDTADLKRGFNKPAFTTPVHIARASIKYEFTFSRGFTGRSKTAVLSRRP